MQLYYLQQGNGGEGAQHALKQLKQLEQRFEATRCL